MTDRVMARAPAPILTVTIEQQGADDDSVDKLLAADALDVTRHGLGTGRAEAMHELMSRVRIEPR
jgi:hypothetical protein